LFVAVCQQELLRMGKERVVANTREADAIAGRIAQAFQVSRQAAMIRLKTLEVLATRGQEYLI
jgi:hypothetical protein